MQTILNAILDQANYEPDRQIIIITGRDLSARLINREICGEAFLNSSASDAVSLLATQAGLSAEIDPTDGLVGQFSQYEHKAHSLATMHRFQTAWDFCSGMQQHYGFNLWVDDETLYFKSPDTSSTLLPLLWSPASAATSESILSVWNLSLERRYLYSQPISVTVSSWDARQRARHSSSYPTSGDDTYVIYNYNAAIGTTQDNCSLLAEGKYRDIMAHATTVTMNVHPALDIQPRQRVQIQGTGTSFDSQIYGVDELHFHFNAETCSKTVVLRNRSEAA